MANNTRKITVDDCRSDEIIIDDFTAIDALDICLGSGAVLTLKLANFGVGKNLEIAATLKDNAELLAIMADFSSGKSAVHVRVDLAGINARGTWKLSSLARGDDDKHFDVSFNHLSPNTSGLMDNYGVARDSSRLVFSGVNEIVKGAKNSKTRQSAKIIVFDEGAIAKADPQLRIGENKVEASHAAIVGKLSDEHLFYLMSRGLSLGEAKRLITYGYLKPIADYFADEKVKSQIARIVEERV